MLLRAHVTRCEATIIGIGVQYFGDKIQLKDRVVQEMKRLLTAATTMQLSITDEEMKAKLFAPVAKRAAEAMKFKDR